MKKKLAFLMALVCSLTILFAGCTNDGLVGTYKAKGSKAFLGEFVFTLTLKRDKTFRITRLFDGADDEIFDYSGTYTYDKSTITLHYNRSMLEDDDKGNVHIVFTRQKDGSLFVKSYADCTNLTFKKQ